MKKNIILAACIMSQAISLWSCSSTTESKESTQNQSGKPQQVISKEKKGQKKSKSKKVKDEITKNPKEEIKIITQEVLIKSIKSVKIKQQSTLVPGIEVKYKVIDEVNPKLHKRVFKNANICNYKLESSFLIIVKNNETTKYHLQKNKNCNKKK